MKRFFDGMSEMIEELVEFGGLLAKSKLFQTGLWSILSQDVSWKNHGFEKTDQKKWMMAIQFLQPMFDKFFSENPLFDGHDKSKGGMNPVDFCLLIVELGYWIGKDKGGYDCFCGINRTPIFQKVFSTLREGEYILVLEETAFVECKKSREKEEEVAPELVQNTFKRIKGEYPKYRDAEYVGLFCSQAKVSHFLEALGRVLLKIPRE